VSLFDQGPMFRDWLCVPSSGSQCEPADDAVAGFSPRRPGLNPRTVDVGFVLDKTTLG
jgi:hypothetical protein